MTKLNDVDCRPSHARGPSDNPPLPRIWTPNCPQSEFLKQLGEKRPQARTKCCSNKHKGIEMTELAELSSSRTKWRGGRLLHIHVAPAASFKMKELAEANFVAGRGIEGDRYFLGIGTYSAKPDFRDEVTVFEMEVLEAPARNDPPVQSGPIKVEPIDHRRNLTVRGVPLNHLVGQRFRAGSAVLFGGRLLVDELQHAPATRLGIASSQT
jgi:hypothetical protein